MNYTGELPCKCVVVESVITQACAGHGGAKPAEGHGRMHALHQTSKGDGWVKRHQRAICGCGKRFYLVEAPREAIR